MLGKPRTNAERLYKVYVRFLWRSMSIRHIGLLAVLALLWPLIFLVMCGLFTARIGPAVAVRTGKSVARQWVEQVWLAVACSLPPDKYYVFELFRAERLAQARDYVMRYELKGAFHNLMHLSARANPPFGNSKIQVTDKLQFARSCRAGGVDTPEVFVRVERSGDDDCWALSPETHVGPGLPKCDIFIKPATGKGGRGCERWMFANPSYRDLQGREFNEEGLIDHLMGLARLRGRYLIQECLSNHADLRDLSGGLTSLRVISCRTERDEFEVTNATFKIAFSSASPVDNFHRGGGVARVDIATGTLGPASDSWRNRPCVWHATHPVTGARIEGRTLPLWRETLDLATRAHRLFPDRIMLGFDVAITGRGPVVIEGNVQSGCDMIQRTCELPVGRQRLGELLAFHATRAMAGPLPEKRMTWFGPQDYFGRK